MGILQKRIKELWKGKFCDDIGWNDVMEIVEEMQKEFEKKFSFLTDDINVLGYPEKDLKELWEKWFGKPK